MINDGELMWKKGSEGMMKNLSKYFQIKSMALDENSVSSTIATPFC